MIMRVRRFLLAGATLAVVASSAVLPAPVAHADAPAVARGVSLTAPAAKLRSGDRYLLVVRSARTKKLIASGLGTVR
jgi:hypothetical protein